MPQADAQVAAVDPRSAGGMPSGTEGRTTQSLQAIARRAELAVRDALPTVTGDPAAPVKHHIAAHAPDPRLRLATCRTPLQGSLPAGPQRLQGRVVVQVGCLEPVRWTVLVPVTLETSLEAFVATRTLPRGAVPGAADLQPTKLVLPGLSTGYVTSLDQLRGSHLARPLPAGAPLTRDALAADPVIRRGEAVTLLADVGGMQVRAPGRALADAAPGQLVRVQNVNSLKIVEGRADTQGMVEVDH